MPIVWDDASTTTADVPATPPSTPPSTSPVDDIATNIASIESGGRDNPYVATGPRTSTGDRAHGKYQIMGNNIPSWTEEATGKRMTPQQFLADPDAQEKTAHYQLGKLYDKYGNPKDVASVWHSGVPYDVAAREGRADSLGTKTTDYANRVASGVGAAPAAGGTGIAWDEPAAPAPTPPAAPAEPPSKTITPTTTTSVTTTPTSTTPQKEPPSFADIRNMDIDQFGRNVNAQHGLPENHWFGKYAAQLGKPGADALFDVYNSIRHPTGGGMTGEIDDALKMLRVVGVPAEAVGNVAWQAANDAGFGPDAAAAIALLGSWVGASKLTPMPPEAKAAELPPVTGATETTTGAAARATEAQTAATEARGVAEAAKAPTEKSAEAAARAQAALAPERPLPPGQVGPPEPPVGPKAAGEALQRGAAAGAEAEKTATRAEYDSISATARDNALALAPERSEEVATQVRNLREAYGAEWVEPTQEEIAAAAEAGTEPPVGKWEGGLITGQQAKVLDEIEANAKAGNPIPYDLAENFKRLLDTVLPFRPMEGMNPKMADLYNFKLGFRDMMRESLGKFDPKLADRFDAANARWANVQSMRDFARTLAEKDPEEAFASVFGSGRSPQSGAGAVATMRQIEANAANPAEAAAAKDAIRLGWQRNLVGQATDRTTGELDPGKLLKLYNATNEDFLGVMEHPQTRAFFETLNNEKVTAQRAAEWSDAADKYAADAQKAADAEAKAATAAEKAAARDAAQKAAREGKPSRAAMITARGLEVLIGGTIGQAVGHPFIGMMAARYMLPPKVLAEALSNPRASALLTRLIKAPVNSTALPVIINGLRQAGIVFQPTEKAR